MNALLLKLFAHTPLVVEEERVYVYFLDGVALLSSSRTTCRWRWSK